MTIHGDTRGPTTSPVVAEVVWLGHTDVYEATARGALESRTSMTDGAALSLPPKLTGGRRIVALRPWNG